MRIHYLQHVPFENLGSMEPVLIERGHQLSSTHLYKNQQLPSVNDLDWLIVMGGPMGIYDETDYPWLTLEKKFIKDAIDTGKKVLGICLGAQLIADALGAKIYKNKYREIGWFEILRHSEAASTILANVLSDRTDVFHWHGDTFDLPENAIPIAESEACKNQGFVFGNRVIALQFHLETTLRSAQLLIENCSDELDGSRYVQSADEMLFNKQKFLQINKIMSSILYELEHCKA